ncbi:MAG TPA: GH3 auxin-responsive promoter family protein [Candidatus Bathyarchaeia archaeon]|nr:GH3 auxin-responsive promoter family protein [Candidatus Bathyarchaeia archaeon]
MELFDPTMFLKSFVDPWYNSLRHPEHSQAQTLAKLVEGYSRTEYGDKYGAKNVKTITDFQRSFPIVDYWGLFPWLEQVRQGRESALLSEPVETWVMTRGTTGVSKVIPATKSHLDLILMTGARALINFALKKNDFEVLSGEVLNLNFPSDVNSIRTREGEKRYGYSSGTYARLNPSLGQARLVPKQEEIDALGGGSSKMDWEKRFELVHQRAKDRPVKSVMGVTTVIEAFARYVKKHHRVLPKNFWNLKAVFLTSVAKIQTKHAPIVRHFFGRVPVVEMYTATEGVFAQQLDDNPYVCPNYDAYLFEAVTRGGVKPLYELKPREWGRIIVSTPLFPRYDIGDFVEAEGQGYYRIIGRTRTRTALEHVLYNLMSLRFT